MDFKHSKFVLEEEDDDEHDLYYNELYNIKYAEAIITKNPEILADGSRTFIPATRKRVTHNIIRNMVMKFNPNSVVVTLNGTEKNIRYTDDEGKEIAIDLVLKSGELGDLIAYHLNRSSIIFITCVLFKNK